MIINNSNFNLINRNNIELEYSKGTEVENIESNKSNFNNAIKKDNFDKDNKKELDKALNKLNKFLEDEKTHAEYSIHKDLGTLMIKIVNDETEDIILEVPPQKVLDMVASICKSVGILDEKV